jgi:DHA2 family multidrug resistance protein
MVTTVVAQRSQFHQSVLAEHTNSASFQNAVNALAHKLTQAGLSVHEAQEQALARLYASVRAQAAALSYIDLYFILAIAAAVMFALSFLMKKNNPGHGGAVAAH